MLKRRPLQNAAIIGKRRTGKTSLLNYLKSITTTPPEQLRPGQKFDWLAHPESYCWIFVDFQDHRMASRERLLGYLLESMQLPVSSTCDLEYFMDGGSMFFSDIENNQVDTHGLTVLRSLAARGEGAVVSRKALVHPFPERLEQTLELLLRRELIEPVNGGYRFQVELIRRWFADAIDGSR